MGLGAFLRRPGGLWNTIFLTIQAEATSILPAFGGIEIRSTFSPDPDQGYAPWV